MQRALQLAACGCGRVSPNPMVGAVIVWRDKIIGEGYHRCYGQAHAEVNAIESVEDKSLLAEATIYVSLEPCCHYGNTPPCAKAIIESGIKHAVIAIADPFPKVAGGGIQMLRQAGVEVEVGLLHNEAYYLNRHFFTRHQLGRPYITLKWAQTTNGFIDTLRETADCPPLQISSHAGRISVHKRRAESDAIMVGTRTALLDNPALTARLWYGKNPLRTVLDRRGIVPHNYQLFDGSAPLLVYTEAIAEEICQNGVCLHPLAFDGEMLPAIMHDLSERKINSLLVEGGSRLLQSFISRNLWDEALVEIAPVAISNGVAAPKIEGKTTVEKGIDGSKHLHIYPNNCL